jgi:protein phosphatase
MAVEIIPRIAHLRLAAGDQPDAALLYAMIQANEAIVEAGGEQPEGRRMGTTAVVALIHGEQVFITNLGDSRAYLIRGEDVHQLTVDHSVAQALVATGALSAQEARFSPYQHVLHKFLGCTELGAATEVHPFVPRHGDRLLLATDGLTNHISDEELHRSIAKFPDPQSWIEHLVQFALEHGSRDNVTAIGIAFEER